MVADGAEWILEVTGDGDEFIEPPADLGAIVRTRKKSFGLGGETLLALVLAIPLAEIARDLSVNILAAWLYDLFKQRGAKTATVAQEKPGTKITINGNVYIVGDAAQLELILKGLRPDDKP